MGNHKTQNKTKMGKGERERGTTKKEGHLQTATPLSLRQAWAHLLSISFAIPAKARRISLHRHLQIITASDGRSRRRLTTKKKQNLNLTTNMSLPSQPSSATPSVAIYPPAHRRNGCIATSHYKRTRDAQQPGRAAVESSE